MTSKTILVIGASRRIGHAAALLLTEQLLQIETHGGSVVLLSSLAAQASVGTRSAYAAAKSAVGGLVMHFASALGARGLRVNTVALALIDTGMSRFTRAVAGREYTNRSRWITHNTLSVEDGAKL